MLDLAIYKEVLEWKLRRKPSPIRHYGFDEAEMALRQDMAAMKVVWYNSFLKDWWCFMRNTHPVLATCLSHRLHMVSKGKRFFVYYMLIALHITCSVLSAEARTCAEEYVCDLTGTNLARWCCTVEAFGLIAAYQAFGVYGLSAIFAVATILFGQVWFLIAACGCCQHKSAEQRDMWERIAKGTLLFFGLIMAALLFYDGWYMHHWNLVDTVIVSFGVMKSISFLGAFFFQSLIFLNIWRNQTRNPHKFVDKFHLTYEDYLDYREARRAPEMRFKPANSVIGKDSLPLRQWRRISRRVRRAVSRREGEGMGDDSYSRPLDMYSCDSGSHADFSTESPEGRLERGAAERTPAKRDPLSDSDPVTLTPGSGESGGPEAGVPYLPPPREPALSHGALVDIARVTREQSSQAHRDAKALDNELRMARERVERAQRMLSPARGANRLPPLGAGGHAMLPAPPPAPWEVAAALPWESRERSVSAPPPRLPAPAVALPPIDTGNGAEMPRLPPSPAGRGLSPALLLPPVSDADESRSDAGTARWTGDKHHASNLSVMRQHD